MKSRWDLLYKHRLKWYLGRFPLPPKRDPLMGPTPALSVGIMAGRRPVLLPEGRQSLSGGAIKSKLTHNCRIYSVASGPLVLGGRYAASPLWSIKVYGSGLWMWGMTVSVSSWGIKVVWFHPQTSWLSLKECPECQFRGQFWTKGIPLRQHETKRDSQISSNGIHTTLFRTGLVVSNRRIQWLSA